MGGKRKKKKGKGEESVLFKKSPEKQFNIFPALLHADINKTQSQLLSSKSIRAGKNRLNGHKFG